MKQFLLLFFLGSIFSMSASDLVEDQVSLGTSGASQVWYSLEDGEQGQALLNEWHLSFATTARSSELFFNDAAGYVLSVYPGSIDDWNALDTAGYYQWTVLHNDYLSWTSGAFSYAADPNNGFDFGWGLYDLNTHNLSGNRIFVVKAGTTFKKLKVDHLLSRTGDFKITVANLDGTEENVIEFNKSAGANKLFGYINILTGEVFNREPDAADWDLLFTKYYDNVTDIRYLVTGILQNDGVTVAKATPVEDPENFTDTTGLTFKTEINSIGYTWKTFDLGTFSYKIEDSTVYFVKSKSGKYWRVIMTGYASANTVQSFKKEQLNVATGIVDRKNQINVSLSVYPNPASNGQFTIAYDVQKNVSKLNLDIIDLAGRTVYSQQLAPNAGFRTQNISVPQLSSGMYLVRVSQNGDGATQKILIK